MRVPFSGIITRIHVEVGDSVGQHEPILEIADPTITEMEGLVDEVDILSIRGGSKVDLTLDAMPNRLLEGTLTHIADTPEVEQTVVSYPVRISVRFPLRLVPREGLSSVANIIIQEEKETVNEKRKTPPVTNLPRAQKSLSDFSSTKENTNDGKWWNPVLDGTNSKTKGDE